MAQIWAFQYNIILELGMATRLVRLTLDLIYILMKRCILKSKNPRNQVFMEAIHDLKLRSMRCRQEKLAFIYQKIMYSVQRYPMPILCE